MRRSRECPGRVPPLQRAADRLRGRASCSSRWPTRRTSFAARRHPLAHRHRRQAGRRDQGRRDRGDQPLTTAPTPTSTTSRWRSTTRTRTTTLDSVKEVVEDAPIVKFVNLLITQAINDRASDIHLEPTERDLRVRFRIDGVLHEIMRSPATIQSGVISRLKIMADINIAERRIPQDGRLSVTAGGKKIDLRVATLPTVWGEKVVMRVLDNSTAMLNLADLGLQRRQLRPLLASASPSRYGMILVTGPTGSGKSTTLYATLNIVSRPEVNVITVEDPVEYRHPRHQPGADEPQGGADLRRRAALDPAVRPRHRPHR